MGTTRKELEELLANLNDRRDVNAGLLKLDYHQPGDSRAPWKLELCDEQGRPHRTIWGLSQRMTAGEMALVLQAMLAVHYGDDIIK